MIRQSLPHTIAAVLATLVLMTAADADEWSQRETIAHAGIAAREPIAADFRDLAGEAGLVARTIVGGESTKDYILETTGGGVAVVDVDNDGWPDLFFVNGSRLGLADSAAPPSRLYRSNRNGTFTDVTETSGLTGRGWGQAVCAGDYDNDGFVDLFVTYYGRQILYRNNGDGTFTDVTEASALPSGADRWNTGATFVDVDRDGHLDLFVSSYVAYGDALRYAPGSRTNCFWKGLPVMCGPAGLEGTRNRLFRNRGDGTFTEVTGEWGLLTPRPSYGFTPVVLDYDNDGWPDVYVANDSAPSFLFHNTGTGTFREVGLLAGVALSADGRAQAGMGVGVGDYDRDGWLDIVKTNFDDDTPSLYRNLGNGSFEDATSAGGLAANNRFLGWGTGFFDFDLDGWPDIYMVHGHVYPEADRVGGRYSYAQQKLIYRNLGNGRFEDVSPVAGSGVLAAKASRGSAIGDLFNTGRQAIVVNNMHDAPTLLHDCARRTGHSLVVQLEGTRSNRSGIGARVTVHVAGRRLIDEVRSGGSFGSQNDLRIHVGLGDAARADRLEVAWPSGASETVSGVEANGLVVIREGSGVVRREPFGRLPVSGCP